MYCNLYVGLTACHIKGQSSEVYSKYKTGYYSTALLYILDKALH